METLSFARPEWLWLLPLALLPLWRWQGKEQAYPALHLLPADGLSRLLDWGIRLASGLLLAALLTGMAEPYQGAQTINRIGTGAHVVILLDRSSSMNDDFARGSTVYQGPKNAVAREVLNQLVDEGTNDFYGLVSFSTSALYMLPLSQQLEVIRAGINSTLNRGRGSTAIDQGLSVALDYFARSAVYRLAHYLLVSDGGGMISTEEKARLRQLFRNHQVAVYWIYLKSTHGNKLTLTGDRPEVSMNPEYFLNEFFSSLGTPYHAYEIEEPGALDSAIADIRHLKSQPLHYQQVLPRHELAGYCYWLALALLLVLLPVRWLEADTW
ncbi:MAG: vWA domain-containing protein [Thiolinea sp.]